MLSAEDLEHGVLTVENRYDFRSLDHLRATWCVEADGQVIRSGALDLPNVNAGENESVTVPFEFDELEVDAECLLAVEVSLAMQTRWAPAGHTVATGQFELPFGGDSPLLGTGVSAPLSCETTISSCRTRTSNSRSMRRTVSSTR